MDAILNTDLLAAVFEASRHGMGILAAVRNQRNEIKDFTWVSANKPIEKILGQDLHGKLLSDVLTDIGLQASLQSFISVVDTCDKFVSSMLANVNGQAYWLEISATKAGDGLAITVEDISMRKQSVEERGERSHLLDAVLNAPNVGIVVFKSVRNHANEIIDFEYKLISRKGIELTGNWDIIGKKLFEVIPSARTYLNNLRRVVEAGDVETYDARYKDGTTHRWLRNTNSKYGDGFINVWEDITEKKRLEETLAEERTRINIAEALGHVGSFEWNIVTNKIFWSDELYRIHGLEPQSEEITIDRVLQLIHPDDVAMYKQKIKRCLKHEGIIKFTHRLLLRDGTLRYITRTIESFSDERGSIVRMNGNVQDITELRNNEVTLTEVNRKLLHKIHEAEKREAHLENFERIVNSSHDAIVTVDLKGNVVQWSPSAERLYGFSAKEVLGHSLEVIVPPELMANFLLLVHRVRQGESFADVETVRMTKDGRFVDVLLNLFPLKDENGLVTGTCGVTKDITERRKTEEQLRESKERFEAAINLSPTVLAILRSVRNENNDITDFYLEWVSSSGHALAGRDITSQRLLKEFPLMEDLNVFEQFVKVVETDVPVDLERYYNAEGYDMWLRWKGVKLEDGLFVSVENTTDRKQAERELKESRNLLQSVFDGVQSSITVYKILYNSEHKPEDFEILIFNDFAYRTSHTTPQIIGKRLSEVFPASKSNGVLQKFLFAAETGEPMKFEQLYLGEQMNNWLYFNVNRLDGLLVVITEDTTVRKKAIEENYKQLQILQETEKVSGIGTWEFIVETNEFNCSEGLYRLLNLPRETRITPETYIHCAISEDQDVAARIVNHITKDHRAFEEIIRIKSETTKTLKVKIKPLKEGNVTRLVGVNLDITAMVESQRVLKEQAHFINQIAITMPDIVSVIELATRKIEYVNMSALDTATFALEVLNMSEEELFGLVHPDDMESINNYFNRFYELSDIETITLELRAKNKFGEWYWFKARGRVFKRNDAGVVTHCVNIFQNITEQKNSDKALRENKELLQSVFNSTTNTIAVLKPIYNEDSTLEDFEISFANRNSLPFYQGNAIGTRIREFYASRSDKESIDRLIQKLEGVLKTGKPMEYDHSLSNASKHWLHTVAVKLESEIVITQQDITESVESRMNLEKLNESLKQKNLELKNRNHELANFAFIASHDLREPLRKILIFSNYLLEKESENLSEQGVDYCIKIIRAINRMNALIDDILEYSRASSSPRTKEVEVSLMDVLKNVLIDISEYIAEENAVVVYDELPVIKGNPLQLSQLFQNLITNGIKFHREGVQPHITIKSYAVSGKDIDSVTADPKLPYIKIEVVDNGIGFEPRFSDKIFQMFQRLHDRSQFPGTGMGLAICKRVLENHKGFITASGMPGEGAVFSCYFPVR